MLRSALGGIMDKRCGKKIDAHLLSLLKMCDEPRTQRASQPAPDLSFVFLQSTHITCCDVR